MVVVVRLAESPVRIYPRLLEGLKNDPIGNTSEAFCQLLKSTQVI